MLSNPSSSGSIGASTGIKDMETSPGSESESVLTYRSPLCVQQHLSVASVASPPPPVSLMTPLIREAEAHGFVPNTIGGPVGGNSKNDAVTPSPSATVARALLQQTPNTGSSGSQDSAVMDLANPSQLTSPTGNETNQENSTLSTSTTAGLTLPTVVLLQSQASLSSSNSLTNNVSSSSFMNPGAIIQQPSLSVDNHHNMNNNQQFQYNQTSMTLSSPPSSSLSIAGSSGNMSSGQRSRRLDGVDYRKHPWTIPLQLQQQLLLQSNNGGNCGDMMTMILSEQQMIVNATTATTASLPVSYSTPNNQSTSSSYFSGSTSISSQQPVIVNHKEVTNYVKIDPRISRLQHCVMCGRHDVCIPSQNKNICKTCDSCFWLFLPWNVVIKFCKGCKNFFLLEEFSDKPEGTKCKKCRQRGRDNYLTKKQVGGGGLGGCCGSVTSTGSGNNGNNVSCLSGSSILPPSIALPMSIQSMQPQQVPAAICIDNMIASAASVRTTGREGVVRTNSQSSLSIDLEMITGGSDAGSLTSLLQGHGAAASTLLGTAPSRPSSRASNSVPSSNSLGRSFERASLSIAASVDSELQGEQPMSNSSGSTSTRGRRKRKAGDASPSDSASEVMEETGNDLDEKIALSSSSTSPSRQVAKLNALLSASNAALFEQLQDNPSQFQGSSSKRKPPKPRKATSFSPSVGGDVNDGLSHPDSAKSIGMQSGFFFGADQSDCVPPAIGGSSAAALASFASPKVNSTTPGPRKRSLSGLEIPPIPPSSSNYQSMTGMFSTTPRGSQAATSSATSLVTPLAAAGSSSGAMMHGNMKGTVAATTPDGRRLFELHPTTPMVPSKSLEEDEGNQQKVVEKPSLQRAQTYPPSSAAYDYVQLHDVMNGSSGSDLLAYKGSRIDKMRKRSFSVTSCSSNNSDSPQQTGQEDQPVVSGMEDGKGTVVDVTPYSQQKVESSHATGQGPPRRQWEWDPNKNPLMALANVVTPGGENAGAVAKGAGVDQVAQDLGNSEPSTAW